MSFHTEEAQRRRKALEIRLRGKPIPTPFPLPPTYQLGVGPLASYPKPPSLGMMGLPPFPAAGVTPGMPRLGGGMPRPGGGGDFPRVPGIPLVGVPSSPFAGEQERNFRLEKKRESLGLAPPLFIPPLPKDPKEADWKRLNDELEGWMDSAVARGRSPVTKPPAPTPAPTPFAPTAGDYIPGGGRYPQQVIEEPIPQEVEKRLTGFEEAETQKQVAATQKQEAEEARQEREYTWWEGLSGEEQRQITLDAALVEANLSPPPDVPSLFKKKGEVGYEEELKARNDSIEAWLVKGGLLRERQPVLDPLGTVIDPVVEYAVKPAVGGLIKALAVSYTHLTLPTIYSV